MENIFDFDGNSEEMTWEEKVETFRDCTRYLGRFDDYFGYTHVAGFNPENQTFRLCRFVSGARADVTMEEVFEGKCFNCSMDFLAAYVEGLELGIKAMAGVPERMCRIWPRIIHEEDTDEE